MSDRELEPSPEEVQEMLDAVPSGDATPDAPPPAPDHGEPEGAPQPASRREAFRIEGDDWDFLRGRGAEDVRRDLDDLRNAHEMRRSAQEKYDEAARYRRQWEESQREIQEARTLLDSVYSADPEEAAETIRKYQRTRRVPGMEDGAPRGESEWKKEAESLRGEIREISAREAQRLLDGEIDRSITSHDVFKRNQWASDTARMNIMRRLQEDTMSGRLRYENYKRELPRYVREEAKAAERAFEADRVAWLRSKRDAEKGGIKSGKGPGGSPRTTPKQAAKNGRPKNIDDWVRGFQEEANRLIAG